MVSAAKCKTMRIKNVFNSYWSKVLISVLNPKDKWSLQVSMKKSLNQHFLQLLLCVCIAIIHFHFISVTAFCVRCAVLFTSCSQSVGVLVALLSDIFTSSLFCSAVYSYLLKTENFCVWQNVHYELYSKWQHVEVGLRNVSKWFFPPLQSQKTHCWQYHNFSFINLEQKG